MKKIKIGIDIGSLNSGHQIRGIGFYMRNLLLALRRIEYIDVVEGHTADDFKNVDLIHYLTFDLFKRTLPLNKIKPTVVTIHDVTPLVFPKAYPPGLKGAINFRFQKYSLKSVSAVITDSNASAVDIVKYLDVKKSIIKPVYLAAGDDFRVIRDSAKLDKVKFKYNLPDRFVVYVGNVNWNKNINRMAEAAIKAGVCMVFVGKGFEDSHPDSHVELRSYAEFLKKYGNHPLIKRIGYVEENDLVVIYNLASICMFVSLYEGFGLPILQAQACEIPVITSKVSSMVEIVGEGAVLVEPSDVEQISIAISNVLSDKRLYSELVKKGSQNLKRFSWDQTALQTVEVYRKVAGVDIH